MQRDSHGKIMRLGEQQAAEPDDLNLGFAAGSSSSLVRWMAYRARPRWLSSTPEGRLSPRRHRRARSRRGRRCRAAVAAPAAERTPAEQHAFDEFDKRSREHGRERRGGTPTIAPEHRPSDLGDATVIETTDTLRTPKPARASRTST